MYFKEIRRSEVLRSLRNVQNWSFRKKLSILCTLCLAAFAGTLAPTAHQLAYVVIARETYHKAPIDLSYSILSAIAGLLLDPVILTRLVGLIGRSSVIFWSLPAVTACQIWAALMTGENDYVAFVVSRQFTGLFGSLPTILGPSFIVETTFLHQRGKAFVTYEPSVLLGVTAGPTIGGIIVDAHPWSVTFNNFLVDNRPSGGRSTPCIFVPRKKRVGP